MIIEHMPKGIGHAFDVLSVTALLGTILNAMPAVGALLTVIWTILRIYESCIAIAERRRGKSAASDD